MKIEFRRAGGVFAPAQRRRYSVDTDALPPAEAEELRSMVRASGLLDAPAAAPPSARPAGFSYQIRLEEGGKEVSARVSDTTMPERLRPLISWLQQRAGANER